MELRHLRYFIKSAELLHFTHAAAALHVSQPTLSLQIQQLEAELGSALFERVGRAVRLTEAGQCFLTRARQALREIEAGQRSIEELRGLLRGTLRIGVTYSFSGELLPGMLAEFVRVHPGVHVLVSVGTNCGVEESVRAGELDLGLVCQSSKDSDFNSIKLFEEEIVVVISRRHRLSKSATLRIRDLQGVPLALPTPDFRTRQIVDGAFARANVQPHVLVETNDIDVLLGLAKQGAVAAIVTGEAAGHVHTNNISRIHLREKGLRLTAALIWRRGDNVSPAAARFLDLVANAHIGRRSRQSGKLSHQLLK